MTERPWVPGIFIPFPVQELGKDAVLSYLRLNCMFHNPVNASIWLQYVWPPHRQTQCGRVGVGTVPCFDWFDLKGRVTMRERERIDRLILYLLVDFPNGHYSWGWIRLKPGTWNFFQIFHIGDKDSGTWVITCCLLVSELTSSRIGSGGGTWIQTLWCGMHTSLAAP